MGQIATGFVVAVTSFTEPTFYALMLLDGESRSAVTAALASEAKSLRAV